MERKGNIREKWQKNLKLIAATFAICFAVTHAAAFFMGDLRGTFLGFPLGFYVVAQTALIVYVAAIARYLGEMSRK